MLLGQLENFCDLVAGLLEKEATALTIHPGKKSNSMLYLAIQYTKCLCFDNILQYL